MRSRRARVHASPILWGLVLGGALGAVLVACAGQPKSARAVGDTDLRKEEIQDYWMQIRDWRVELKLRPDPQMIPQPPAVTRSEPKCETVKKPATPVCQDTCTLADGICDNMESICRIAKQLEGDAWAEGKCQSARASCEEARQACCACTVQEESSAAPAPPSPL